MAVYQVAVSAHITILASEDLPIEASSPKEAEKIAKEMFEKDLEQKYPWVDYDEINIDGVWSIKD